MHCSLQFVHCSCHLLFFICPACSKHPFGFNFRLHSWKSAPRPRQEPHFWRSTHWNLHQKYHFSDHLTERKGAIILLLVDAIAPLSARFVFFSLHGCIFRLQEPNWRHNLMHCSLHLVHCSYHLLFFICPDCSKHLPGVIFVQFLKH